jgi:hypothetical protein
MPMHRNRRRGDGDAFIRDPHSGPARTKVELAELLAEGFISGATGREDEKGDEALAGSPIAAYARRR